MIKSFNDTLTNDNVSFEQLGPGLRHLGCNIKFKCIALHRKRQIIKGTSLFIYDIQILLTPRSSRN